jgi:hypothetical protein
MNLGAFFAASNLKTPQKTGLSVEHLEIQRAFQMFPVSFARHPVTGQKDTGK